MSLFSKFGTSLRLRDSGKFKMNNVLNISFDAKFNADSEFEFKNLCSPTHLGENRVLKNLRGRI